MTKISTVALISPSFMLSNRNLYLDRYIDFLKKYNIEVILPPHINSTPQVSLQAIKDKASDIMEMYKNPKVDALFCLHGGAGALNILEHLDYDIIKQNPKPIFGFSDNTSIQLAVYQKTHNPFVTGFSLEYDLRQPPVAPLNEQDFSLILQNKLLNITGGKTQNSGVCEGILLGECLSTISDLNGTPFYPDLTDAILLLEDEEEISYKLELMLTQLRLNPQFNKVKGIIFGKFANCNDNQSYGILSDIIRRFCSLVSIPVITDFEFGHTKSRHVLPCGIKYRLDADSCTLSQLQNL